MLDPEIFKRSFFAITDLWYIIDSEYRLQLSNQHPGFPHRSDIDKSSTTCFSFFYNRTQPCPECRVFRVFSDPGNTGATWNFSQGDRVYRISSFPVPDEREQVEFIFCQVHDITNEHQVLLERSKAMAQLLKSEANLKEAERMTMIGHWELDLATNSLSWSDGVFFIFGLQPGEVEPSYDFFLQCIHPEDRELVDRSYRDSVSGEAPYELIYRLLLSDGTVKFVHEKRQTEWDSAARPRRTLGTVQVVTESYVARKKLRQQQQALQKQAESIQETNAALRALLKLREEDKVRLENHFTTSLTDTVIPCLDKLKAGRLDPSQKFLLNMARQNLEQLFMSYNAGINSRYLQLTPMEMKIVELIKQAKSTKEIAEILCLSPQTIATHRRNIRKKLGLTNKAVNLRIFLLSL